MRSIEKTSDWIRDTLDYYAHYLLCKKYGVEKNVPSNEITINPGYICADKRRISTLYKTLDEIGLNEGPSWGSLKVNHEKFLELAPQYAQAPVLDTLPLKKGRYSYESDKVLNNPEDKFYDLLQHSSNKAINIYVYLHQDEYVFRYSKEEKTRERSRYQSSSTYTIEHLRIYPKNLVNDLQKNIFDEKIREAMWKRLPEVLGLFEEKTEALSNNSDISCWKSLPWFFDPDRNKKDWSLKSISKRIDDTYDQIEYLKRTMQDLENFSALVETHGDEQFEEECFRRYREHIIRKSPLYINDEKNPDLQELAKMVFKGNHKGIIPDQQEAVSNV